MLFSDTYFTINASSEAIFREKGSKFIAYSFSIRQLPEVKPHLEKLRAMHPKANHHCWAARTGPDRTVFRINDDGEPSGTAGRPILNALLAADITNTLIVVVRYFGGTLLGVSGLIRAYRAAANEVLQASGKLECTLNDVYEINFPQEQMNAVMRIIKENRLQIISANYTANHILQVSVRKSEVNKLTEKIGKLPNVGFKYLYSD